MTVHSLADDIAAFGYAGMTIPKAKELIDRLSSLIARVQYLKHTYDITAMSPEKVHQHNMYLEFLEGLYPFLAHQRDKNNECSGLGIYGHSKWEVIVHTYRTVNIKG